MLMMLMSTKLHIAMLHVEQAACKGSRSSLPQHAFRMRKESECLAGGRKVLHAKVQSCDDLPLEQWRRQTTAGCLHLCA